MTKMYDRLKALLMELFQLDQPDLDFGIYRIMSAKRAEVAQFLDHDLLPQIREAFAEYRSADKVEIEQDLAKAIEQAHELGVDPDSTQKVQELKKRMSEESVDLDAVESEIYDLLYSFFRRYYSDGDFLTKRVYKPGVYAIPYEGEEVKLHWANRDQYYIKTDEYLRDYAFRLNPDSNSDPMRVHLRVVSAAEGEHDNVKAVSDDDRVFVLASSSESATEIDGELVVSFEFRPATFDDWPEGERKDKSKPPSQRELVVATVDELLNSVSLDRKWVSALAATGASPADPDRSILRIHLDRYVARNTFDYFIHKDLGGFLNRELDFFIKTEVIHLGDLQRESTTRVSQYVSKVAVLRSIASKIIAFIAQIEEFQKRLWLKKKFVVDTRFLVTLDRISEDLYQEVASNSAQVEEWEDLFAIHEIVADLSTTAYSNPPTIEFLRENQNLIVDTRHFSPSFVERLVADLDDVDEECNGLLVHSENLQAVRLLAPRYQHAVNCVYLDPPYNTDATPILYKNGYKSSTWVSLMYDRLLLAREILADDGVVAVAIDDEQQRELAFLMSEVFEGRRLGTIVVRSNPSGRPIKTGYSVSHEYLLFAGQGPTSSIRRLPPTAKQMARFSQRDEKGPFEWRNLRREGSDSNRDARRSLFYPIFIGGETLRVPEMVWNDEDKAWDVLESPAEGEQAVWPTNDEGDEKRWRWEWETVMGSLAELAVRPDGSGRDYVYYKRRPHAEGVVSVSSWFDAKYSATEHGSALMKKMFGESPFLYPKSIHAVKDAIYIGGAVDSESVTADYFAGSGTTGHAVLELNRDLGGNRKYLLTEMGHHFETALVPRIKKAIYAERWEGGKPKSRDTGISQFVKVIRLESYEDTLNNLDIRRSESQSELLADSKGFREDFLLRYQLNVETKGSRSLLDLAGLEAPWSYQLDIRAPGSDENLEATNVDLIETFNWLIGLSVRQIGPSRRFDAEFSREGGRLTLDGALSESEEGPWKLREVYGTFQENRVLVIWRTLTGSAEKDNLVLDAWFRSYREANPDRAFDLVYVNGDNNLENLRDADETWSVRLTEDEFDRLMFEGA